MQFSLAPGDVVPRLRGRFGQPYVYAEVCSSTQRLLGPEHAEGAVAVADEQTEGRGRLGRRWYAPAGTSILCSVLLRPAVPQDRLPELSPLAARACADAISDVTAVAATVKEPNDVLIAGRKVAGILGEAREGFVVLGVGINVNVPFEDLPQATDTPATSLLEETGASAERAPLLAALLVRLEQTYDAWVQSIEP